jgi:hypothetical protein
MCHCVCGAVDADDMGQLDGLTTPEALEAFRALYIKCVTRDTPLAATELGPPFSPAECCVCVLACTRTCTHARSLARTLSLSHTHTHTHTTGASITRKKFTFE